MIAHQCLKIAAPFDSPCRVRLEGELPIAGNEGAQCLGFVGSIVDHLMMIELDARLDHQRNDSRPGGIQTNVRERRLMSSNGRRAAASGARGLASSPRDSVAPPGTGTSVPMT